MCACASERRKQHCTILLHPAICKVYLLPSIILIIIIIIIFTVYLLFIFVCTTSITDWAGLNDSLRCGSYLRDHNVTCSVFKYVCLIWASFCAVHFPPDCGTKSTFFYSIHSNEGVRWRVIVQPGNFTEILTLFQMYFGFSVPLELCVCCVQMFCNPFIKRSM